MKKVNIYVFLVYRSVYHSIFLVFCFFKISQKILKKINRADRFSVYRQNRSGPVKSEGNQMSLDILGSFKSGYTYMPHPVINLFELPLI
jgi:hypothetical protein